LNAHNSFTLEQIAAIAPRGAGRPSTSESSHEQSKEEQIKLLELRCDHYEKVSSSSRSLEAILASHSCLQTGKTEKRLSEEIDTIAKAWTQLEDQNSRKVLDLTGKEEEIIKCHTEVR
jgi:3-dehydroquinate dehydratase